MKIFISWSGEGSISQQVANELNVWLPMIIQNVDPWISTGISSGDRWNEAINNKLSETSMGIICVTKENITAPWLNFEAGAIAKGIINNKVIPLLINLRPSDLSKSPLSQFQAKSIERASILELLSDINDLNEKPIQKGLLSTLFDHCWSDFAKKIEDILAKPPIKKVEKEEIVKPSADILEELLSITRDIRNDLSYRVNRLERIFDMSNKEITAEDIFNIRNNEKHQLYLDGQSYLKIDLESRDKIHNDIIRMTNEGKSANSIFDYLTVNYKLPKQVAQKFIFEAQEIEKKLSKS